MDQGRKLVTADWLSLSGSKMGAAGAWGVVFINIKPQHKLTQKWPRPLRNYSPRNSSISWAGSKPNNAPTSTTLGFNLSNREMQPSESCDGRKRSYPSSEPDLSYHFVEILGEMLVCRLPLKPFPEWKCLEVFLFGKEFNTCLFLRPQASTKPEHWAQASTTMCGPNPPNPHPIIHPIGSFS